MFLCLSRWLGMYPVLSSPTPKAESRTAEYSTAGLLPVTEII